jgi:hypothetical protein
VIVRAACCALAALTLHGQEPPHRASGRVVRGTRAGPVPVADQWVILHRVGNDRSGPLDSVRTTRAGGYAFSYRVVGDSQAIYFASTSYGGVAYFTSPFRAPVVAGDDAAITVFDTTSNPAPIKLAGRHIIIGAAQPTGRRPVGEVLDLENDSTVTVVARDSTPLWTAHVPSGATDFQLNSNSTIAPGAINRRGSSVGLFAPISPGLRQFAFTYELPPDAFPLSLPLERTTGLLEILVQEPTARVEGPRLREVASVTTEGRNFRRYLADELPGTVVVRISVPAAAGAQRMKVIIALVVVAIAAMLIALAVVFRRRLPAARRPPLTARRTEVFIRDIATLDAELERRSDLSDNERAEYGARRATLKQQLADALAEERRPS